MTSTLLAAVVPMPYCPLNPESDNRAVRMHERQVLALPTVRPRDLSGMVAAARKNKSRDSLGALIQSGSWQALSAVLQPIRAARQQVLIAQGAEDRSLFFIESGMVRVFRSDGPARMQLAVIGAGSVVGDGAFFGPTLRTASVQAVEPTVLWELTQEDFLGLVLANAAAALNVALAVGSVLSKRMLNVTGRLSIT
jgi:CRP/FNR family cyclic AMP-dependent transcriptional regulator